MVVVSITSASAGEYGIMLDVSPDELSNFLITDESSNAREYLKEFLSAGHLEGRPEWDITTIQQEMLIEIPSLNLKYILQEELEQPQIQCQPTKEQNKKKSTVRWTYRWTLRLIFNWTERRERFENNIEKNETIWEELAEAMITEGFHEINASQCENKFKYLKRMYLETKDINRKATGQPEKTCPFYEEMDMIFRKSPQVCPPSLASNRDGTSNIVQQCSNSTEPSASFEAGTTNTSTLPTATQINGNFGNPPAKKTRLESSLTKWADEFQEQSARREAARQKRHEELLQIQRESNELYKNMMMKLLEKF